MQPFNRRATSLSRFLNKCQLCEPSSISQCSQCLHAHHNNRNGMLYYEGNRFYFLSCMPRTCACARSHFFIQLNLYHFISDLRNVIFEFDFFFCFRCHSSHAISIVSSNQCKLFQIQYYCSLNWLPDYLIAP